MFGVVAAGLALALAPIVATGGSGKAVAAASTPPANATSSWTVYHGDSHGSGVDTSGVTFNPPKPAWASAALDGQVYGEPLEATGRVFVATENDTIYALAANTGAVLWSSHVGTPVPADNLPCGDISPSVGITGTPVVDEARSEIFAVADEEIGGTPAHFLVGLNIYTGATMLDQAVGPPGQVEADILQRPGLNLDHGNVIVSYGGNGGDCASYSGWVLSVPEGGGSPGYYQAVPIGNDGAVWMGGAAPEVDAAGNIWVAIGNGSPSAPYDYSDSVLELSPGLTRTQFFSPTTWMIDNAADYDLGSSAPALLSNGTVLQVGKSSTAYLLNQASLGGISTPSQIPACGADADGGDAVAGTVVYVPCLNGLQEIQTSPFSAGWQTTSGAHGPPIIAGGLVWSIGGSQLYGLNPANGQAVEQVSVGGEANHFPTPSVGDGLLLAPSADQVYAFTGSAGLPGPPASPPGTTILIPSNGASLSGTVTLDASAAGAAGVKFYLFGGSCFGCLIGTAAPTIYGWIATWNSTMVSNGSYLVVAQATSGTSNANSQPVSITVANPTTRVLIPSNGASLTGTTTLDASATNASGVKFYLFGGSCFACLIGTATPTTYGWISIWNTATVANGSYTLFSQATAKGGTTGLSPAVSINIKN